MMKQAYTITTMMHLEDEYEKKMKRKQLFLFGMETDY
ncbi:MAG: Unknown protein [uncultured Sulfurovum sp.]|uniref:Uncharacterized protein n=1 Tax=uncultured Sulfurovum sp. TaxID=269237 RepID=A0A6S6SWS5_9BACT|nr:MAG: Unknown protein [uncultured Sulfurovum sp.]